MDIAIILNDLKKVEEALKCAVCSKQCINPVKIKSCGHYFCLKCFKIKAHHDQICPKCMAYYEEREIDYDNLAKQNQYLLDELKEVLLVPEPHVPTTENTLQDVTCSNLKNDSFVYKEKTYHVTYLDDKSNKVNAKGETTLHMACKKKKLKEVISLVGNKSDLNVKDFAGWAPLHEAVQSGSVEIVEILLENGALVDIPAEEYMTPLHKAVMLGNKDLIEMLLKYKANTECIDYCGKKPMDYSRNEMTKSIFSKQINYIDKIQELFCTKKIIVYLYYIEEAYQQKLSNSKFIKIAEEYDSKKVTHFLIRKTHKLSLKMMVAMLDGCFLFPQEWIDDALKNNYFISIPNYIFISEPKLNNGIRRAILNSLLKLPKLFDGLCFFIRAHNNPIEIMNLKISKHSLSLLITSGGGKILHRAPTPSTCEGSFNYPYHSNIEGKVSRCCHYLIYEEKYPPTLQYQMAEIKHRTSKWLIDCIINFTICE